MRPELKRTMCPEGLAEHLYAQGYQALEGGDSTLAIRCFALQLLVGPSQAQKQERAWIGLGAAHEQLEQYQKAAAVYRLGAARLHESVWLNIGLGRAARRLGRPREAALAFERAELVCSDPAMLMLIQTQRESEEV